jgi:hypothetical protein
MRDSRAAEHIAARYALRTEAVALWLGRTRWVTRPEDPGSAIAAAAVMLRAAGAIPA